MSEKLSERIRNAVANEGPRTNNANALADEVAKLESCDLCDEPAEYRQCQGCMNDKLVGSHTDEEYKALKQQIYGLQNVLERYPPEYMVEEDNIFTVYCQACEGSWRNGADSKHDEDCEWEQALESGGDDETKNEIPPKVGREDVEHPHPQP